MTDLTALIERLENAEGPSRELDASIAVAIGWKLPQPMGEAKPYLKMPTKADGCAVGTYWLMQRSGASLRTAPKFTESIDPAMTLVPEGWDWNLSSNNVACICRDYADAFAPVFWSQKFEPPRVSWDKRIGTVATPALALSIAALRARQAMEADK
jgi:hypothetical protein